VRIEGQTQRERVEGEKRIGEVDGCGRKDSRWKELERGNEVGKMVRGEEGGKTGEGWKHMENGVDKTGGGNGRGFGALR